MLEEDKIRWVTYDGRKPLDDDLKCGILSSLAIYLDNQCQVSVLVFAFVTNVTNIATVCNCFDLHKWVLDLDDGGSIFVVDDPEAVPPEDEGHGEEDEGAGAGGPAVHLGLGRVGD